MYNIYHVFVSVYHVYSYMVNYDLYLNLQFTESCVRFESSVYVVLESSNQVILTLQRDGNLETGGVVGKSL